MAYKRIDPQTNETLLIVHNMYFEPLKFEYETGECIYQSGEIKVDTVNQIAGRASAIFKITN